MAASTKRNIALALLFLSSASFGSADLFLYRHWEWTSMSWVLNMIIGVILIVGWCTYDSQMQGYPLIGWLRLTIVLVAIVGVPIYLVKSRDWRRAAKIGFGLPAYIGILSFYYAGWYGSYWVARASGYFHR